MKANAKRSQLLVCWICGLVASSLFFLTACSNKEQVLQVGTTDDFVQDLNPPFLDVLWMVSDRSPMGNALSKLLPQAQKFFERLDGATASYRMAFASADMEIYPGQLRPVGSPVILTKGGDSTMTPKQRVEYFRVILSRTINLSTGATERGLESVLTILKDKFQPRANIPLVVVLISDAEDRSVPPGGGDPVTYYEQQLLALKGNNRDLLRVYAMNYSFHIPEVDDRTKEIRCATQLRADIDIMGGAYIGKYFELAKKFSVDLPDPAKATGDLCQAFADNVDISGLRQKEPVKRFALSSRPRVDTLQVRVFRVSTEETFSLTWHYEEATNEVVFDAAPPEGTNIRVTYYPD